MSQAVSRPVRAPARPVVRLPDSAGLVGSAVAEGLAAGTAALRRHLGLLAFCLVSVPLIGWIGLQSVTPLYTARATVNYQPVAYAQTELKSVLKPPKDVTDEMMTSQENVIASEHFAALMTDRFHLEAYPEFNYTLRPRSLMSRATSGLESLVLGGISLAIRPVFPVAADQLAVGTLRPPSAADIRTATIESVQGMISARAMPLSNIIAIGFTAREPQLAAEVANALAETYIAQQLQTKVSAVQGATRWLEGQAQQLRQQVVQQESEIAAYETAHGLARGLRGGLPAQQISLLNQGLANARADLAQAQGQVNAATGRLGSGARAAVSPSVVALRGQRDALSAQLHATMAHLGPRHPTVIAMRRQLGALQRQMGVESGQVTASYLAAVHSAEARVAELEEQLRDARESVATSGRAEIPLDAMRREANASSTLLQAVLGSIQRLTRQAAIEAADARMVSPALVPGSPSVPRTRVLLAAALVAGLSLGLLLIYLAELTQSKFRSGHDIRTVLGLNCLAQIPQIDGAKEGVAGMEEYLVQKPFSLGAEQIRALRAALWLGATRPKVVAIAAARPGEGKTTTSICLARSAALAGERIVVVECDTRKPSFAKLMGIKEKTGLLEFLSGTAPLEDVIHTDKLTSFDYIPSGVAGRSNSHALFMSENMVMLLERLRRDYDLVVLDLPPVIALTDARIVASLAEATLLCVRWQTTPRAVAKHCYEMLQDAQANVVGAALTRVNQRAHAKSGHTDAEAYHSRYAPYYQN